MPKKKRIRSGKDTQNKENVPNNRSFVSKNKRSKCFFPLILG